MLHDTRMTYREISYLQIGLEDGEVTLRILTTTRLNNKGDNRIRP